MRFRAAAGRKIIQRDLRTTDRVAASIEAGRLRASLFDEWQGTPGGRTSAATQQTREGACVPTTADFHRVAVRGYRSHERSWQQFEQLLVRGDGDYPKRLALLDGCINDVLKGGGVASIADHIIEEEGWEISRGEQYDEFARILRDAMLDSLRIERSRLLGDVGVRASSEAILAGLATEAMTATDGETLNQLFERYASQRLAEKAKRPDSINQDRKVVAQFCAFVGVRRSLASITPADVRSWRDTIAQIPPNYTKIGAYTGLDLKQAAAAAAVARKPGLHPVTVNKCLSAISAFFRWAVDNRYVTANPCDGLFFNATKAKKQRHPFTIEQLNTIFSSPLFTGFLGNGKEHVAGDMRADDWRFWIPLICLFTGARLGEIAQLRIGDVEESFGVSVIHIREDESADQRTKSGRSRFAPVHSKLGRLGFFDFVARRRKAARDGGTDRLFPELKPNSRDQISGTPSRFFRDYLGRIGVKQRADGLGPHAFRHTLADQLRAADYLDNEIAVALGHSQKSVTGGYGILQQGTVKRLREMFEAVRFDGLKLDHLIR
jgi:integrase